MVDINGTEEFPEGRKDRLHINTVQIDGGWTYDGGETPLFGTYRRNILWQPREHDGIDLYETDPSQRHDGQGPAIRTGGAEVLVRQARHTGYGNTVITMSDHLEFEAGEVTINVRPRAGTGSEFPDRHGYPEDHHGAHRTEGLGSKRPTISGEVRSISSFTLYGHLGEFSDDIKDANTGDLLLGGSEIGALGRSGITTAAIGDHLHMEHWLRLDMADGSKHVVAVDPQALLGQQLDGETLDLTDPANLEALLENAQGSNLEGYAKDFDVRAADRAIGLRSSPRPQERPPQGPSMPEYIASTDEREGPNVTRTTPDTQIRLSENFQAPALGAPAQTEPDTLDFALDRTTPLSPFEKDPVGTMRQLAEETGTHTRETVANLQEDMSSDGLYVGKSHRFYADGDAGGLTEHAALLKADEDGSYARETIADVLQSGSMDERSLIRFQTATNHLNTLKGNDLIDVDGRTGPQTYTAMLDHAAETPTIQVAGNISGILEQRYPGGIHERRLIADTEGNFARTHIAMSIEQPNLSRAEKLDLQRSINALNEIEGRPPIDEDGVTGKQTYGAILDYAENVDGLELSQEIASNLESRFPDRFAALEVRESEYEQAQAESAGRQQFEVAAIGEDTPPVQTPTQTPETQPSHNLVR